MKELKRMQIRMKIMESEHREKIRISEASVYKAFLQDEERKSNYEFIVAKLESSMKESSIKLNEIKLKMSEQNADILILQNEVSTSKMNFLSKEKDFNKQSKKLSSMAKKEEQTAKDIAYFKSQLVSLTSDNEKQIRLLDAKLICSKQINANLCEEIKARDERERRKQELRDKRDFAHKQGHEVPECVFCQENTPDMLVMPCKHISLCRHCFKNEYNEKLDQCPTCMGKATEVIGPCFLSSI